MKFIQAVQALDFNLAETKTLLEFQENDHAKASDIFAVTLANLRQAELEVALLNRFRDILGHLADPRPQDAAANDVRSQLPLKRGSRLTRVERTKNTQDGEEHHHSYT